MAAKQVSNKYYRYLKGSVKMLPILLIFLLPGCKKNKPGDAVVYETVPAEYSLGLGYRFHLVKNSHSNYDTTISLSWDFSKTYPVQKKTFTYENAVVTCNNYEIGLTDLYLPNTRSSVLPARAWKISSPELGELSYTDTTEPPRFSDPQWWKQDSIREDTDLVLDLSSFSDYTHIFIQCYHTGNSLNNLEVHMYEQGKSTLTLHRSFFNGGKGFYKLNLDFCNIKEAKIKKYPAILSNAINFSLFITVY